MAKRETEQELHARLVRLCQHARFSEAVTLAESASSRFPGQPAFLHVLGGAHLQLGAFDESQAAFRAALQLNPKDAVACYNLGLAAQRQEVWAEAAEWYARAASLRPGYAQALNNLGSARLALGAPEAAIDAFEAAVRADPARVDALYNLASALRDQGQVDRAAKLLRSLLAKHPRHAQALALLLRCQTQVGDFSAHGVFAEQAESLGISTAPLPPHALLSLDPSPERALQRARVWASSLPAKGPAIPAKARSVPLRVGYFSSDFGEHPSLRLIAGLFRAHDRGRIEPIAFDLKRHAQTPLRQDFAASMSAVHDVAHMSEAALVDFARGLDLDIAVDLNGFTKHARTGLFAHRIAPVQIAYLGYPGTLGGAGLDYLVADQVVVPETERAHIDERIIFLPHSHFVMDNRRTPLGRETTRADHGLPEAARVLCCFNAAYKIGPRAFAIWMQVLREMDDAVLWLLGDHPSYRANLSAAANRAGVEASRLHFAPHVPQPEHLERLRHADLFVDTFNYNAHTTGIDALWQGVPVVTLPGRSFPSRVGASLLLAAELPDLIAESEQDYERKISDLVRHPARLQAVRQRLLTNHDTAPLFDTGRFTNTWQTALETVHGRAVAGEPPQDLVVGD